MPKRQKQKKKPSVLRRLGRFLYRTVTLLSVLVVAGFFGIKAVARRPEQAPPATAPPAGSVSALSNVSDAGGGDDPALPTPTPMVRREGVYTFLLTATDVGGGNTDTIMVVTYDTQAQKVGVVSIPRDTLVNRKNPKINSVYAAEGMDGLMAVVGDLLGFPIDHHVRVNINGFKRLVNAVDGVDFYVPCNMNYDDTTPGQELRIHYNKGMQHLNGQQALEVVRFRHNNDGSGYTDVGRTQTQQKLLMVVAKKALSLSSLGKLNEFVNIFTENVDTSLTAGNIAWFATQALTLDFETAISTNTLPGDGSVKYNGTSWCYQLEPEACLEIFNELLNPYTEPLTMEHVNIFQAK